MNETNILSVTENFSDRDHMNLNVSLVYTLKDILQKKNIFEFPAIHFHLLYSNFFTFG